jgi:hypothetical protein
MNWIKGATNNCDLLDSITDQFEELSKEVGIRHRKQRDQRKLVKLEVRGLPRSVNSYA